MLAGTEAEDPDTQARVTAFLQGLQQLGWTDGRNVRINFRWNASNPERMRKYVAELAVLSPDIIVATGAATLGPLLQATRSSQLRRSHSQG
jgi:putative tryptophan/tyrosine transport system substrate-binding protein